MTDDGPTTREEWLENNKAVMEAEQATEDEIFYNSIETRLKLAPELRTEADERLGDAYVNSLAQHEARLDSATWAPLSVRHLMDHEGVTMDEASAIVAMTAMEYGNPNDNI